MTFGSFHPISAELVELMTPAERSEYDRAFRKHLALQSPLDMALLTTPRTKEYAHIVLLNTLLVALVEHRLYKAGPCLHPSVDAAGLPLPPFEDGEPPMVPRFHPPDVECFVAAWAPGIDKLFVTMPPRHGKSYLISEHLPAWFLARYPEHRVIFTSYGDDFAAGFGRKARDIVKEHGDLLGLGLDAASQAAAMWDLAGHRGGMTTAGAGSQITGKGGSMLVCDDPIKNQEEALSEADREKKHSWWHATFKTRREPGAVMVLVHTRWHEDDMGGRLMQEEGEDWFHIDLPALQPALTDDGEDALSDTGIHSGAANPLCREEGGALCPERYSASYLANERKGNEAWFDALYQQRPSSEGAGIFKRSSFLYWEAGGSPGNLMYSLTLRNGQPKHVMASACYHFLTVDVADSEKEWADFTVYSAWALTPDKELLLVDRFRKRLEDGHVQAFETFLAQLRRGGSPMRLAGVEDKTYGRTLIKSIIKKRIIPVRRFKADKDKMWRAQPAGEACDNGVVFWPKGAPWLREWEQEHTKFPVGTHDDQVDTTAYAVHLLYTTGLGWQGPQKPKEPETLKERLDAKFDELTKGSRRGAHRHPEMGRVY